jgi:hypothetical protein
MWTPPPDPGQRGRCLVRANGFKGGGEAAPDRPASPHRAASWLEAIQKAKLNNPPLVAWTPARSIEDMDKAGIATADAARVARESNQWARRLLPKGF